MTRPAMPCNLRRIDRVIRAIVGAILMALAATYVIGPWGWLGLVPVITAALGWCPAYTMLGISTRHD